MAAAELKDESLNVDHVEEPDLKARNDLPDLGKYASLFEGVTLPPRGSEERAKLERKLKLKLDLTILPAVILMFILNYLDRNNIAAAKLGTLMQDLNLSNTQFSTCQAILFVGYIPMQLPANIILERLGKPQIFLPGVMAIWGMLSTCIFAVKSYGGLLALRLLLGFFEAAFYPGVIFYLSCWYTRAELAKRMAIFYTGSLLSGAFSGLIAYGVMSKLSWRYLFLIEGIITIGVSLICMTFLPELPATTRWLSKEERLLGVVRLSEDIGQADDDYGEDNVKKSVFTGLIMSLKDIKVYYFLAILFSEAATASINAVFPTIVGSLNYGESKTLLLTVPPWILVTITSIFTSWHSDKKEERYWHLVVGPVLSLIGFVIGISTLKTAPRYVAMMLLLQVYNSYGLSYAWASSSLPRPPIKRAAAISMINIGGNLPNVWAPYLFTSAASPHFYAGFGYCIAFVVVCLTFLTIIRFHLMRLNKKLDAGHIVDGMTPESGFRFML